MPIRRGNISACPTASQLSSSPSLDMASSDWTEEKKSIQAEFRCYSPREKKCLDLGAGRLWRISVSALGFYGRTPWKNLSSFKSVVVELSPINRLLSWSSICATGMTAQTRGARRLWVALDSVAVPLRPHDLLPTIMPSLFFFRPQRRDLSWNLPLMVNFRMPASIQSHGLVSSLKRQWAKWRNC